MAILVQVCAFLIIAPLLEIKGSLENVRKDICPIQYQRRSMDDIRAGAQPYFLGGKRRPYCEKCEKENWQKFCTGQGYGPVCAHQNKYKTVYDLAKLMLESDQEDLLTSTPCELWPHIEGRTTWLFGDSQMIDLYKALVCTMRDFVELEDGPPLPTGMESFGLFNIGRPVSADHEILQRLPASPSCVHFLGDARICYIRFNRMEEMTALINDLHGLIALKDITILNFALHHSSDDLNNMLPLLLNDLKRDTRIGINLYYKDSLPQHFPSLYGHQPANSKPPFQCLARAGVSLNGDGTLSFDNSVLNELGETPGEVVAKANARNANSLPHAMRLGIPIIHTYNRTTILHDFHRDNGDGHECSHYCYPVPGLWAHATMETMKKNPPSPIFHKWG